MHEQGHSKKAGAAGILLGVGLGGFVDGIVLHQILQWHNMLSAKIPPHTMDAMRVNMTWDGLFHAVTWLITVVGLILLHSAAKRPAMLSSTTSFIGQLVLGWGVFNLVEGVIDHHLLSIHNVREVPDPLMYNLTFLVIGGAGFIAFGWMLMRRGKESITV